MSAELFDLRLRSMRRDRAFTLSAELFLYDRVFEDCLDRIALNHRDFRSCLLLGCPDPDWPERLGTVAETVEVADPGRLFAEAAGGSMIVEDEWAPQPGGFELCVAIGTLDSVNDLQRVLRSIRLGLRPDSLLIGAIAGGEALPRLRLAMHAADQVMGASTPHVHPRIEPSAVAPLLMACGFVMPVVDVDRVQVSYRSFDRLIHDLRRMGATNILNSRSRRPLTRSARAAAAASFEDQGGPGPTIETFEIIHFAAWTPAGQAVPSAGMSGR